MSTVRFYLNKPNKNNLRSILLTYNNGGEKFRYSTKIQITEKEWNPSTQRVRRGVIKEGIINDTLTTLQRKIESIEIEARLQGIKVSAKYVHQKLLNDESTSVRGESLINYFDVYIEANQNTKRESTLRVYKATKSRLIEFQEKTYTSLTLENINSTFYEKFIDFLIVDIGLLNNSVGKHIKIIKAVLNYLTDKEINKNLAFKKFKVYKEDVDIIYLTEEELINVYNFKNLPPRLNAIREVFCFGCFTGLRISDLNNLKRENINKESIEIKTQKTKDKIIIPLNKYSKEIIKRNKGIIPSVRSNQKTNEYLKELGQLAGINKNVLITKYRGKDEIIEKSPKFNFITTHTARRTFVTLSLEKGMRIETVMSITGHKDYATFKKYIKLTDSVKEEEMNKAWK
jgi:integrase